EPDMFDLSAFDEVCIFARVVDVEGRADRRGDHFLETAQGRTIDYRSFGDPPGGSHHLQATSDDNEFLTDTFEVRKPHTQLVGYSHVRAEVDDELCVILGEQIV